MEEMRRIGAHYVVTDSGTLKQCVVEIMEDRVVNYFTFADELPLTEWLGGTIELKRNAEGILQAWQEGKLLKQK